MHGTINMGEAALKTPDRLYPSLSTRSMLGGEPGSQPGVLVAGMVVKNARMSLLQVDDIDAVVRGCRSSWRPGRGRGGCERAAAVPGELLDNHGGAAVMRIKYRQASAAEGVPDGGLTGQIRKRLRRPRDRDKPGGATKAVFPIIQQWRQDLARKAAEEIRP